MKKYYIAIILLLSIYGYAGAAITCSGTRVDVVGQKYSGTVDSAGAANGGLVYIEVAGTPFEQNLVETGTADSDCQFNDGTSNRPTLEDNSGGTASFTNTWADENVIINTNESPNIYCKSQGVFTNTNLRMGGACFKDVGCNDTYEIYGYNPDPADWTVVFDGNMLVMTSGVDAGSQYNIHINTNNRLFMTGYAFGQGTPSNGDTFIIPYSKSDMVYYGCGSGCTYNATAGSCYYAGGKIFFQNESRRIMAVDHKYNGRIGDNSTWTHWGEAGYAFSVTNKYPDATGWGNSYRIYGKTTIYASQWNPTTNTYSFTPSNYNYDTTGYSANAFSPYGDGDKDAYFYGIRRGEGTGQTSWPSTGTAIEMAYSDSYKGKNLSYHNDPLSGVPNTANSIHDYVKWTGGNWGEPLGGFGGNISNGSIIGIEGAATSDTPPLGRGLGWLGSNSGSMFTYFSFVANANLGLYEVYKDGDDRDVDYWQIDQYADYDYSVFFGKSVQPTVVDAQLKTPLENVVVTAFDRLGNIISYADSTADIAESVDTSETLIDISDDTPFTAGDIILIDHEYMSITTVTPGTPDRLTVVREARLPLYYPALPHENNTDTFDPSIYIVEPQITDANGQIPNQFYHWATMVHRRNETAFRHQVTHGEPPVNYTCTTEHTAEAAVNEPPSAWWTDAGTQGIPWDEGKRYSDPQDGTQQFRSYDIMCPCIMLYQRPGHAPVTKVFNPNMDSIAFYPVIEMERRRFIETRSREGL